MVDPKPRKQPQGGKEAFRRLESEVDRMFLELMGADRMLGRVQGAYRPNVDVFFDKAESAMIVKLELAGIDPDTVTLEVEERILRIHGHRVDQGRSGKVYQQMEIAYGPFERRILLPVEVDPAKAQAHYERGFLEISLPVAERRGARRIPVVCSDAAEEDPEARSPERPDPSSVEGGEH
jgi:HSP20 family protein